jgi:hypothetical protein
MPPTRSHPICHQRRPRGSRIAGDSIQIFLHRLNRGARALSETTSPSLFPHRMGRNYLKGRDGDRINEVMAVAGYNFSPLLRWLTALLRAVIAVLFQTAAMPQPA